MQSEAIDGPHKVARTNFSAINQWGGLSWPFTSISRLLCCYYLLDYSPSAKMNTTSSRKFISVLFLNAKPANLNCKLTFETYIISAHNRIKSILRWLQK